MDFVNYRVNLDMFDALSQTTIKAKKGDSACRINITLIKNGKIFQIGDGSYAKFSAKKSDGTPIHDYCTIEGDTIVYNFASSIDKNGVCQVSACEGNVDCEVTLYNANGEQLTSPRFVLFVDGTVYNGEEIISSPESDVLKSLVLEARNTITDIENKLENGEFKGEQGDDYILTDEDKQEIANLVDIPKADQTYDPESENAQSGRAVREAISGAIGGDVNLNDIDNNEIISIQNSYNLVSGTQNVLGIKGYKILNILIPEDSWDETDAKTFCHIIVKDKDFEESNKAVNNYAINDVITIRCATIECETYAITKIETATIIGYAGNSVITVKPYNAFDKTYTNEKVNSSLKLNGGGNTEDWVWVRGKSCGEPVGRTQGSFLGGINNTSVGMYTFGAGKDHQLTGDGATAFGRQNIVGYLSFGMGRGNTIHGGYAFGNNNKTEYGSTPFISGTNNTVYKGSKLSMIFGHNNRMLKGDKVGIVGHSNSITGDALASMIAGSYNELQGGDSNFVTGIRHIVKGLYNFVTGAWNNIKGTSVFAAGQYIEDTGSTANCGFIGKGLTGSGTEQLVVGHFNADDVNAALIVGNGVHTNSRKNAFVIKKTGEATLQGEMTANGVNLNKKIAELENTIVELKKQIEALSGSEG